MLCRVLVKYPDEQEANRKGNRVKICTDVAYSEDRAAAGVVGFRDWGDSDPAFTATVICDTVQPYIPGKFYLRELPCLLAAIRRLRGIDLEVILIDGYVWLAPGQRWGLGAYLHEAVGGIAVVGVAKSRFRGAEQEARAVFRGRSRRPLYVTAVGLDVDFAAAMVERMAGAGRIPALVRRADRLARRGIIGGN
ncbi:MAG: endonuclease V [Verrucomicrobia bacterium]|nr:MAG: endonuclease V [Verrucomicrobiota bacterium]